MRGLKKTAPDGADKQTNRPTDKQTDRQTHGHGDSMTNSAHWGRVGEKSVQKNISLKTYIRHNIVLCPPL